MNNFKLILTVLVLIFTCSAFAQFQVDKAIELTGTGVDAKVTGIQSITGSQDAVNANAVINNTLTFATATGSSNAYAVTLSSAITGYNAGMVVQFIANFSNSGPATLNVNSLGAKTIKKNYNADLFNTDIKSGQAVIAMYDGTNFQMLSQSGNGSGTSLAHGKQIFYYIGGPQYFTVPDGVTSIDVKLWGSAGGNGFNSVGGGGAFVKGTLVVTPNTFLTLIIGQGGPVCFGNNGGCGSYGGGGISGFEGNAGTGGGRTAIQVASGADIVTAGGGGGGSDAYNTGAYGNGGGGGAPNGAAGGNANSCGNSGGGGGAAAGPGGAGGVSCSASLKGGDGAQYLGGSCNPSTMDGASGGGGYYGGGAGGQGDGGGGGGGSSFTTGAGFTLISNQAGQTVANGSVTNASAGGNSDPDYVPGIGFCLNEAFGGNSIGGGNGLIVISW